MSVVKIDKLNIVFGTCPCYNKKRDESEEDKLQSEIKEISAKMSSILEKLASSKDKEPTRKSSSNTDVVNDLEKAVEGLDYVQSILESAGIVLDGMKDNIDPLLTQKLMDVQNKAKSSLDYLKDKGIDIT